MLLHSRAGRRADVSILRERLPDLKIRVVNVRGYKEEGTITTPLDMTMLNDLNRFHLVIDTINRLPQTGDKGTYLKHQLQEKVDRAQALHRQARPGHAGDSELEVENTSMNALEICHTAMESTGVTRSASGLLRLNGETPGEVSNRADRLIARLHMMNGNVALFSHSHFGRVLAVRWIGLAVERAQHLLLSTASVSVLCYEHEQIDRPAIALWNYTAREACDRKSDHSAGDASSIQQRAIERWENEGGEIPARKEGV